MDTLRRMFMMLIQELGKMIDRGDFDEITKEELETVSTIIHHPKMMGREDAAKFLKLTLKDFYYFRKLGIIPMPKKIAGLKEKQYCVFDLKKAKISIENLRMSK